VELKDSNAKDAMVHGLNGLSVILTVQVLFLNLNIPILPEHQLVKMFLQQKNS